MSDQLPYRLDVDNRRAVVSLLPELNEVPWADIEKVGTEILSRIQPLNSPQLLVDLCALNYMGSAQVALVVRMFKLIKEKSGKMVVANRDPMVLEVLSLAGLNKVWTIVESRERAMSMLGGGASFSSSSGSGSSAHEFRQEGNSLPGTLALIAALVAAVFCVLHVANPALIPSRGDLYGILAASAAAFLAGLWAMNGGNRNLGIGVLVAAVAMLLFGVFEIAKPGAPLPTAQPADPSAPTTPDNTTTDPASVPPAGTAPTGTIPPVTTPPGAAPGTVDPAGLPPVPPGNPQPGTTPPTTTLPPK